MVRTSKPVASESVSIKKNIGNLVRQGIAWMKTHPSDIVFYLGLLALFVLQVAYVQRGGANVPYMDKLRLTEYKEIYFNGASLQEIYASSAGGLHWAPIGFIYPLIEYNIFHSDYMHIMYVQCVVFFVISLLLYWSFKDTVPKAYRCLFLLPVLQVFTFTKWEITLYAALSFMGRIFLLLIAVLLFNRFLKDPQHVRNQITLLLVPLILFLAGGAYGPAMVASMAVVLLVHGILTRPSPKILVFYGLFVLLLVLSYVVRAIIMPPSPEGSPIGGEVPLGDSFTYIFTHLWQALSFFFLNLASSVFGITFLVKDTLQGMMGILLGVGVFLAYVAAIVLFFAKKIYERTYVPLVWIGYSLFCVCLFMLARINYPVGQWMASRYVYETCFGTLGVLWIYVDVFAHRKVTVKKRIWGRPAQWIAVVMALYMLAGFVISNVIEWRAAPYRRSTMNQVQTILTYPEMYEEADFAICQAPMDEVLRAIHFYKSHDLSFFRTAPPDYSVFHIEYNQPADLSQVQPQNMPFIRGGLSGMEGNGRRFVGSGLHMFFAGDTTQKDLLLEMEIEPYLGNGQLNGQTLQVYMNDIFIDEYYVSETETLQIRLPVEYLAFGEENVLNKLVFSFPDAVSPKELAINKDVRLLSFSLLSFEIKTTD